MPADRLFHPKLGHSVKVCSLSHLEARIWQTYILTADDFGVMRFSPFTIQAANEAFEQDSHVDLTAALEKLVAVGLVEVFEHQGRRYCFQLTWQNEQRVKHPRDTMQPMPPATLVARCTPLTRKLFEKHSSLRGDEPMGGSSPPAVPPTNRKPLADEREVVGSPTGTQIEVESDRVIPNTRLTANGLRLTANGSEEGMQGEPARDPPMDEWLLEVQTSLYPGPRVTRDSLTIKAFVDAMNGYRDGPWSAWRVFRDRLAGNVASHEWRVKGMIPKLEKYICSGQWQNDSLPESPPVAERLSSRTNKTIQGAADALRSSS